MPRRKLKAAERIEHTSTDVEALKWFMNRTESTGAVLLYWDDDDCDGLYYGRTPNDVQIGRELFRQLREWLAEVENEHDIEL